jgi:stringent starvation protein B
VDLAVTARRSTKPYLVRAIYEWCIDCGETPFLSVRVSERVVVPRDYVRDGEIVLNISAGATRHLAIGNDAISFSTRFSGVSHEVYVPVESVAGIFSRESGQGMFFDVDEPLEPPPLETLPPRPAGRPRLHLVK